MIDITLPDGSVGQYASGTGMEIAQSISEGLARNVLSISVDGNADLIHQANRESAAIRLH